MTIEELDQLIAVYGGNDPLVLYLAGVLRSALLAVDELQYELNEAYEDYDDMFGTVTS